MGLLDALILDDPTSGYLLIAGSVDSEHVKMLI